MLKKTKNHINKLPQTPGVYFLKNTKGTTFYIGKAINIKKRVKSHFPTRSRQATALAGGQQPTYRNNFFKDNVAHVGYIKTESEIEALLLESQLIKKHRPKYNILLRDDKQYFYVCFSGDRLSLLTTTHQPSLNPPLSKGGRWGGIPKHIGPFTDGNSLKIVLRYLRKIFPYYTSRHKKLPCPYCHIDLCPGPNPNITEYKKNIVKIKAILRGRKPRTITSLKKEMAQAAKNLEFEKAAKIRGQITALENIFAHHTVYRLPATDYSHTTDYKPQTTVNGSLPAVDGSLSTVVSLEAYDISNIQGKEAVASMVRLDNGKPNKSLYRKFRIRLTETPNDIAMIKEAVRRRLAHTEWPYPELMLIDGGRAQLNAALSALSQFSIFLASRDLAKPDNFQFSIVALAKKHNELYVPNRKKPIPLNTLPKETKRLLMYARDEAHRFAISYHRKLHRKQSML